VKRFEEWIIVADRRDGRHEAWVAESDARWGEIWNRLCENIDDATDPDRLQSSPDDFVRAYVAKRNT
jgi:hypothetical protein